MHGDLVKILRDHPLTRGLTVMDKRKNEHGTPAWIGILNHHTASGAQLGLMPSLYICQNGRPRHLTSPAVPGPLCNILIGRDGTVAVISNGIANHAGTGDPNVIRRVRTGQRPQPRPGPDQSNAGGNTAFIGIECENNGLGETWSPALLNAMYRVNAALCDTFRWDPFVSVLQHYLWTRRKIDCAFINPRMTYFDFQHEVAAMLDAPDTEDDMGYSKWTDEDKDAFWADFAVRGATIITGSRVAKPTDKQTNLGDVVNVVREG